MTAAPGRWTFACAGAALFALLGIVGVAHHELWLDEAHHWMLAAHSGSLRELLSNARYEGHPPLWHLLLFALGRFTVAPLAMQLLHVAISTAGVLLFLARAPFSRTTSAMVVLSYFVLYEYTIIARNYGLMFLLLTVVVAHVARRPERPWGFLAGAALLAASHLFGLFAAAVLAALALADRDTFRAARRAHGGAALYLAFAAFACLLAGLFAFCVPPPDHFFAKVFTGPLLSPAKVAQAGAFALRGLLHVPDLRAEHFWGSNILASWKPLAVVIGAAAWLAPAVILADSRRGAALFYAVALLVALFLLFTHVVPATRYHGVAFLALVFARWLADTAPGRPVWTLWRRLAPLEGFSRRWSRPAFTAILALSVGVAAAVYAIDLRRPFSQAKAAAALVTARFPGLPVLVSPHTSAPPIAAYLRKPVYFVENRELRTFCRWSTDPFIITDGEIVARVAELLARSPAALRCVLLTTHPLAPEATAAVRLREIARLPGAILGGESYVVYTGERTGAP